MQSFVEFDPVVPVLGSSDEQLFAATIIQGYVTGSFFLLLALFILTHQFAVCCGYCPPLSPGTTITALLEAAAVLMCVHALPSGFCMFPVELNRCRNPPGLKRCIYASVAEKAKKKKSAMSKGPQVKPSGSKPVPREV